MTADDCPEDVDLTINSGSAQRAGILINEWPIYSIYQRLPGKTSGSSCWNPKVEGTGRLQRGIMEAKIPGAVGYTMSQLGNSQQLNKHYTTTTFRMFSLAIEACRNNASTIIYKISGINI